MEVWGDVACSKNMPATRARHNVVVERLMVKATSNSLRTKFLDQACRIVLASNGPTLLVRAKVGARQCFIVIRSAIIRKTRVK